MILREGVACAGPWWIEHVHEIDQFPGEGGRALVKREAKEIGGVFAVLAALRRRHADLPLSALGLLGEDEDGHAILAACHKLEVDTFQLLVDKQTRTASAMVLQSQRSGRRTSFHLPGANALLDLAHFDFRHCLASWFHLHDLAQLGTLGRLDDTGMPARALLQSAKAAGLVTSLFPGELAASHQTAGLPALLEQVDYLFLTATALALCTGFPSERVALGPHAELSAAAAKLVTAGGLRALAVAGEAGLYTVQRGRHGEWQESSQTGGTPSPDDWCAAFLYECYCRERQALPE
ncbi:MAG: PfkB family carbohydrate kinase [candidate division KSB1 bacterium]|nr:PfkB family carbohydrate kinase [candidate division KSB1 bacterium]MDZ7274790.1 PfkB family carbohydrate kinase [candidate division KSB1 bacterium]MDZ7285614.1 PfkB family carbohydrate kinase [candidate division KSB1 bacterium]MDZ7298646.1 PfkB family carbohydrate kinase [candidate division KSB1 bacterium]MDZ7307486.1 PfkB family carbohydrate kinase [candidate division KSB1 bacterium]